MASSTKHGKGTTKGKGKAEGLLDFPAPKSASRKQPLKDTAAGRKQLADIRKQAAKKAAERRASTKHWVTIGGKKQQVTTSQLAGLRAAAAKREREAGKTAKAKA